MNQPGSPWAGGIYADSSGTFGDNQFRFALLSLAACEAPLVLNIGGYKCVSKDSRPAGSTMYQSLTGGAVMFAPDEACQFAPLHPWFWPQCHAPEGKRSAR